MFYRKSAAKIKTVAAKNRLVTLFLVLGVVIAAALLTYFIRVQTGGIRVTHRFDNGDVYSGYWRYGVPYGAGFLATASGRLYDGVWDKDGRLTHGLMVTKDYSYSGAFDDYMPQGFGECRYNDGNVYYGHFAAGRRQGLGRMEYADGTIDFGHWDKGRIHYPEGQNYHTGNLVYGMDVSNHQKRIEWDSLTLYADANGIVTGKLRSSPYLQPVLFVLIKSSEGTDFTAHTFERNFAEAKRCGIVRGAYHFLRLSDIDGQIRNFIDNTPLQPGDLPPVLDMELDNSVMAREKDKAIAYAHKWLEAMERHYGVRPMLYTYDSYYNNYLKGEGFEDYDFFIARYSEDNMPRVPHLEIWQFSEKGNLQGINAPTDLDIFMGDYADFKKYVSENCIRRPSPGSNGGRPGR